MQCSKCHRDATIFQPYSGLHLCDQHLVADVEAKAKKMIRAQGWLRPGDHIGVLLSRDPRSGALLYFLKKLTAQRRDIRIIAVTIVKRGDSCEDALPAKRIAEFLDTAFIEVSFPEISGSGSANDPGKDPDLSPVSPLTTHSPTACSLERNGFAQQHGITRIAREVCLDEVAGLVFERIVRGDAEKLVGNRPCQEPFPWICPFIAVSAAEVSRYAELCGFDGELSLPGQGDRLHKDTIDLLNRYMGNHPATRYALLNLGENLVFPRGITGLIQAYEFSHGCYEDRISEVMNGTR